MIYSFDLKQSSKNHIDVMPLPSVQLMAAELSHEVKNPLTAVKGFIEMLQGNPEFAKNTEMLKIMLGEINRANMLLTDFTSLTKEKPLNLELQNLNEIIDSISPALKSLSPNTSCHIDFQKGSIGAIEADTNEVKQLLLNLVKNGIEAMPHGGIITIKTYSKDSYNVLEISDNGSGIPSEILSKIGTPFETTKDSGTGLGLPICYNIVKRHRAKMNFKTSQQGTTFVISFPQAKLYNLVS